jgi:hypothetical protein
MPPPLLKLADQAAYQQHFVSKLCAGSILAHDGIPVFFKRHSFYHAFFETVIHKDDTVSLVRAERMDWIEATLTNPQTQRLQGYIAKTKNYDPARRVELRYQNFIVVLIMGIKKDGSLKAEFLTCYAVNNNRLPKVRKAPVWNRQDCQNALQKS